MELLSFGKLACRRFGVYLHRGGFLFCNRNLFFPTHCAKLKSFCAINTQSGIARSAPVGVVEINRIYRLQHSRLLS